MTLTAPARPAIPVIAAPRRPSMARLALMLGAFVALGPLTIDMYLPALPTIREELATTSATVQLTLTAFPDRAGALADHRPARTPSAAAARCLPGPRCTSWRPCWC